MPEVKALVLQCGQTTSDFLWHLLERYMAGDDRWECIITGERWLQLRDELAPQRVAALYAIVHSRQFEVPRDDKTGAANRFRDLRWRVLLGSAVLARQVPVLERRIRTEKPVNPPRDDVFAETIAMTLAAQNEFAESRRTAEVLLWLSPSELELFLREAVGTSRTRPLVNDRQFGYDPRRLLVLATQQPGGKQADISFLAVLTLLDSERSEQAKPTPWDPYRAAALRFAVQGVRSLAVPQRLVDECRRLAGGAEMAGNLMRTSMQSFASIMFRHLVLS